MKTISISTLLQLSCAVGGVFAAPTAGGNTQLVTREPNVAKVAGEASEIFTLTLRGGPDNKKKLAVAERGLGRFGGFGRGWATSVDLEAMEELLEEIRPLIASIIDILIEANEAGLEDLDEDALRDALRGPLNELRDLLVNGISTVRTNRKDIAGSAIGGLGNLTGSIGLVADLLGLVFGLLTALMEPGQSVIGGGGVEGILGGLLGGGLLGGGPLGGGLGGLLGILPGIGLGGGSGSGGGFLGGLLGGDQNDLIDVLRDILEQIFTLVPLEGITGAAGSSELIEEILAGIGAK